MNNTECVKKLRSGLNKYLDSTFYVPGFADAIRHAINELESEPEQGKDCRRQRVNE